MITATPATWPAEEELGEPNKLIRLGHYEVHAVFNTSGAPSWTKDRGKQLWARVDEDGDGEVYVRADFVYADKHPAGLNTSRTVVTRVQVDSYWLTFDDFMANWVRFKQPYDGIMYAGFPWWTLNKACSSPVDSEENEDYEANEFQHTCAGDDRDPASIISLSAPRRKWSKAKTISTWKKEFGSA